MSGDFGYFGKGLDGYVQYKQTFDETQKGGGGGGGKKPSSILGWIGTILGVIFALLVIYYTLFS